MNIYQLQKLAKNNGFDSMKFVGKPLVHSFKEFKAKWLDAYLGLFEIEGQSGFTTIDTFTNSGIDTFYDFEEIA